MSQQGGGPTRQDDDWWRQLYDEAADDTGPTPVPDSLDDRYASAKRATTRAAGPTERADRTDRTDRTDDAGEDTPARLSGDRPPDEPPPLPAQRTGEQQPAPPAAPVPPAPAPPAQDAPAAGRPPAVPPMPGWPAPAPGGPPEAPRQPDPRSGRRAGVPAPRGPVVTGVARFTPGHPAAPPTPDYVGSRPPTYAPEPTALPAADPDRLDELVSDTVLEGARYGACTLRAVSLRGDSARYRGEARRDALLVARFGAGEHALVLVAMATGARAAPGAHRAAAEACRYIGQAVGRSHERLVEDLRAGRRGDLKSGLHRLTDRTLGRLRADAAERDLGPEEHTASLRCLLLPADPDCRTRVFFGAGEGGLFRLRDGEWLDIEPADPGAAPPAAGALPAETPDGDRLTLDLGIPVPPSPYEPVADPAGPPPVPFRFRAAVARPGDVLMMCTTGLADPLRGEPSLRAFLGRRWSRAAAPGLAGFLADALTRVKGYADDRTAAAVWEA
ncbi:protein phosphatase 2C domain-containing protein [Streptomyces sp. NPDC046860]|uniref:protein phosphatase 2C domain-containing protein n=1 Tax=Streptomyces sp. NPDC046860 TaxID=3154495 RepID=UPI0033D3A3A2